MAFPITFIVCAIGELVLSSPMMFVIFPLALVKSTISILVNTISAHFILNPGSFIAFSSHVVFWCSWNFQNAFTMLLFDTIKEPPFSFVCWTIHILESTISLQFVRRNWWWLFLWRRFCRFLLCIFLGSHICNSLFKWILCEQLKKSL